MVECVIFLCTPGLNGTWETRCSLSHDTCLDTALVKGSTCVRHGRSAEQRPLTRSPPEIWAHRAEEIDAIALFGHIQQTEEHKTLAGKFPRWEILVQTQVCQMCLDLRHLEDPHCVYDPVHDRTGYVNMDCVDCDWNVGCRKAFAYLPHGTAPAESHSLPVLALHISCGNFSHMTIDPARIFGVCGTLSAPSDNEWRLMSKYGLKRYTLLPSVYGESNFRFLDQTGSNTVTIVESQNDFHVAITRIGQTPHEPGSCGHYLLHGQCRAGGVPCDKLQRHLVTVDLVERKTEPLRKGTDHQESRRIGAGHAHDRHLRSRH